MTDTHQELVFVSLNGSWAQSWRECVKALRDTLAAQGWATNGLAALGGTRLNNLH